jgi:2-iminobutanoate/2-iminopropanoate deaminase
MHFKRALLFVTLLAAFGGGLMAGDIGRRYIGPRSGEAPLPFSDAVLVGDTLYLGGTLGLEPKTGQAPAELEREIRLLLDEMQATLAKADMTMDDLVYVTVYCTDLSLYDDFNRVYRTYYKREFPARAFIGVASLLRGSHFELQAIAIKK